MAEMVRSERCAYRASDHTCLPTYPLLRVCQAQCRPTSPSGFLPDILPLCPEDEQDEHVSVVTSDPNHLCTGSCGLQHITIHSVMSASSPVTRQSSLLTSCTLFCTGYPHRMLARRLLLLEFSRIDSLHGSGMLGVRWKSFDPAPARLILSWSFAVSFLKHPNLSMRDGGT